MKKASILVFALILFFANCCQEIKTYRIPHHTSEEQDKLDVRDLLTQHSNLDYFMNNASNKLRQYVWNAIDIMIKEPKESIDCIVTGKDCVASGIFLFQNNCPVVHIFYEGGHEPTLWHEKAIVERGWRNDIGYIFLYKYGSYEHYYIKTNLDIPLFTPSDA